MITAILVGEHIISASLNKFTFTLKNITYKVNVEIK